MALRYIDVLLAQAQAATLREQATTPAQLDVARRTRAAIDRAWRTRKVGDERADPDNLFSQAWAYAKHAH